MRNFNRAPNCKKNIIVFAVAVLSLSNAKVFCQVWTGNSSTDWNTAANWSGNYVPNSVTAVIIPSGVTNYPVISSGADAQVFSIVINSAASLTMSGSVNLLLSNAGSFTNNGTFTASASTGAVIFSGSGTISGAVIFKNITINGSVDFGSTSSVTGNLTLNVGGSVSGSSSHLVNYISSSTLIYNTSIVAGNEWYQGGSGTVAPGAGIPQNVNIQSGIVTIPNGGGTNRAIAGNLSINAGASLQINTGSRDLYVAGSWTSNGSFTANGRRVTFDAASGTQTVSGNTTFYDLTLNNSGATTDFSTSTITMNDELRATSGSMDGNTSTFIFNARACTLEGAGAKKFYNVQITSGTTLSDLTPTAGDTHVSNSFTNDGIFKQNSIHTMFFEKSGGTINLYGNGSTTFGNIVIGKSGFGSGTTLNADAHSFTVSGTDFTFNKAGSAFDGGSGTVTFSGTTLISKSSGSVTGISTSFYGVNVLNITMLGIDVTMKGPLLISTSNSTLNINGNTLTLNGTVTGTGTLTGSATSNLITGSVGMLGTLYFNQATDNITNVLKNFTINSGTVLIGNALNITAGTALPVGTTNGIVTVNGTLNANGYLTLKSNQYGDAIVAQSTGIISGNTTVERFIPARRAWRFLALPVNNNLNKSINDLWQEGSVPNMDVFTHNNPKPGFGTEITYDNLTVHGFDVNTTTNSSILYWDYNTNTWNTPPNTYLPIDRYPAYCLFVRGSRAVDLSRGIYAPADNTILRTTGILNYGSFAKTYSTKAGNYILVSNPYACPIDITKVLAANSSKVANMFWVWDPGYHGNYGVGGYISYSGVSGLSVPAGSSYTGGVNAQSGQAFQLQVQNFGASTDISFAENDKVTAETNVFNKPNKHVPALYVNLMFMQDSSLLLVDGVGAGFGKQFSYAADDDVLKLANFNENITLARGNANLAIELRPVPVLTDTLFYKLYLKQQPYTLQIFSKDMPGDFPQGWLVDTYLNTKITLNLNDTTFYNFKPDSNIHSYRDRFMIVFKRMIKATPVATTMSLNRAEATILRRRVSIYPNPVTTGGKAFLKFSDVQPGKYEITVSNVQGKTLLKRIFKHSGSDNNYELKLDARWATGNYMINISGKNGYTITTSLVIGK